MRPTRFFHLLLIAAFALGTGGCLSERILESSAIREQMNPKSVRYSPALGMLIDAESTFHRTTFWGDDDKLIDNIAARKRWIVVPPARVQRDAVFTSGTTGRNAAVYWVRIGDDMRTTGSVRVIPTGLFDGDATPEDFPSEFAAAPHYKLTDPVPFVKRARSGALIETRLDLTKLRIDSDREKTKWWGHPASAIALVVDIPLSVAGAVVAIPLALVSFLALGGVMAAGAN